jgi:hypothetical protein
LQKQWFSAVAAAELLQRPLHTHSWATPAACLHAAMWLFFSVLRRLDHSLVCRFAPFENISDLKFLNLASFYAL